MGSQQPLQTPKPDGSTVFYQTQKKNECQSPDSSRNWREGNTSGLILQGPRGPGTQTRQEQGPAFPFQVHVRRKWVSGSQPVCTPVPQPPRHNRGPAERARLRTDERIKRCSAHTDTGEYRSVFQRKGVLTFRTTWVNPKGIIMLNKICQIQKDKCYRFYSGMEKSEPSCPAPSAWRERADGPAPLPQPPTFQAPFTVRVPAHPQDGLGSDRQEATRG